MQTTVKLESQAVSDAGLVRTINGDTLASREPSGPLERVQKGSIWIIADGLGSGDQAVRASRLAAQAVLDAYWDSAIPDPASRLRSAIERANSLLYAQNTPDFADSPFGATILACLVVEQTLHVAHAGRSRTYLWRGGKLRQLTRDHTWVARAVETGEIAPEEAATHPRRNAITRCLGIRTSIKVDLVEDELRPGDVIVSCSDGLYRHVDEQSIGTIVDRYRDEAASVLIEEAKRLGGQDNVTVATVAVDPLEDVEAGQLDRIALLSRLGYELTRSPDLDETLDSVLRRLLALSGGERAAILLRDPDGSLISRVSHNIWDQDESHRMSHSVATHALSERRPILITDALDDPRFSASDSIVSMGLHSVLCVPMIVNDQSVGVLYVDSSAGVVGFTQDDLDLLVSFASQAAAAIQNARLHEQLRDHARDVEMARRRQDALFRSLNSALIAIDHDGVVITWNPAATEIFGIPDDEAVGSPLVSLLPAQVASWSRSLISQAESGDQTIMAGHEWEGPLGSRDRVILAGRVARIRDPEEQVNGFVFVLNDRTDIVLMEEARQKERQEQKRVRDLFSRYLAPSVVERLLSTPEAVELGGTRHDVTILFADVRGFTGYSEQHQAEKVVEVLNQYLELATSEIFEQLGTLDKFLGDGVMAIFGAPVEVPNHELAAVRAASAMTARLERLRAESGIEVGFGIGLHSGQAIVGNIGTPQLMSYTAIGDVVNVAARLETEARSGEILVSGDTYERIAEYVEVEELGSLYVKGRMKPVRTFKVLKIRDGHSDGG